MTIPFYGTAGDLFNRLGKCALLVKQVKTYQDAQLTNMTNTTTGVVAQYNTESDLQAIMGSSYISNLGGPESVCTTAQQLAQATFNRMVFRDQAQLNQNLQQFNTLASINEVIRQMKLNGATVLAMTIAATPAAFIGTGNGVIVASTKRAFDGLVMENSFAEVVTVTCSQDSYNGGASEGNEAFTVTGQGDQPDLFSFDWPLGSDCSTNLNAIDGDTSNGSGNLLTNSGFADFTNNVPDNFTLTVGTAGTNISQETGLVYTNGSALKLTGAASALTAFTQQFGTSAGTTATLSPQSQYSFNVFMRGGASPPGAGVLTVELIDSGGAIINDNNNVPNSISFNLTGLTTSYVGFNGVFRTPTVLPDTILIRYRLSTALTNGAVAYLGKSSLGLMTQLYTSGPSVAVHSGSVPFVAGTYGFVTVTNSRGAAGTLSTWQTALARLLDPFVYQNGVLFPSSATPTVSDSLIS